MITVSEILTFLSENGYIDLKYGSDQPLGNAEITGIAEDQVAREGDLAWISRKNLIVDLERAKRFSGSLLLAPSGILNSENLPSHTIECKNPRLVFAKSVNVFFAECISIEWLGMSTPGIHATTTTGNNLKISSGVAIGNKVEIGDNVCIGPNTSIVNATIKRNVSIGANCSIGLPGFGYEKDNDGRWLHFPHLGRVIIEEDVEIGSNTCIDRGSIGNTIIGKGSKIDNLVHIAHNVVLGENSLVIANSMLGGSAKFGDDVWVGPSVSVINKVLVGNNSMLGMGAVVIKNVAAHSVVVGNPAHTLRRKDDESLV